eukprot:s6511_g2.t1
MCRRALRTKGALGAHFYKTHGRRAAYRQVALSAFPVYFQEVEEIVERVKLQVATLSGYIEGIAVEEGSAGVESLRSFSSLVDSLDWAELAGCENSQHGTRDGTSVLLDSDWEVAWRCPSEVLGDATVHHDYWRLVPMPLRGAWDQIP